GAIRGSGSRLPVGTRVLTITASDNGPTPLSDTAAVTVTVVKPGLKREVWTGLAGGQGLSELTGSLYFPRSPGETGYVQDFRAPTGVGDNYGQRLSGFVIPPATGDYTFWIASDDGSELWLSSDASVSNKKRIGYVNGAVGELNWTQQGNQQSAVIPLVAGQAYYIEALQKEGGGGDHLAVAWQGPGFGRTVIPGANLLYPDTYRPALKREVWPGNATLAPPATPPGFTGTMFDFKGPSEVAENFSERVTGYLVPPLTGDYSFWLASDDDGELFLSTDENPANLQSIATVTGYTDPEQWTKFPSQHSAVRHLVAGKRYYLKVHHRDGVFGDHLAVAWDGPGFARKIIANEFLEHPDSPADRTLLKKETWTGLGGDYLPDLTNNALFPATPTTVGTLPADAGLVTPTDAADNFGDRVTGYLVAPDHGRYTFWIASDNSSELWLSTDDNPANKVKIASVDNYVAPQNWDAQASQKSVPVALAAGQRYFLEILRKEGIGGDHLAVAWQGPSFGRQVVGNPFLEHPLALPGKPTLKREVWTGIGGGTVANLTSAAAFQNATPSARGVLTAFATPTNHGDNYGQRLTSTLVAPESGNYKFWIASDDHSELWLSTDEDPANRIRIAHANGATAVREWTKFPTQESGTLPLVEGQRYHIEVLHKEGAGGDHVAVAWQGPSFDRRVIDGRYLEYPGTIEAPVALKREVWTGIGGNDVSNLTSNGAYPANPNQTSTLNRFEAPVNEADNYGQKVSGYLIAPAAGDYTFWIASDDGGELWLATDGNPANKARVAFTNNATGFENWTQNPNQTSAVIPLAAGQRCYIEALQKEGGGDDYLSVAWQGPGFGRRVIEQAFLEYPGLPAAPTQPGTIVAPGGTDPGFTFWLDYNGLEGADRLASADPDGDKIPNDLEFVLGGKPAGANAGSIDLLPTLALDPTWAIFEFRRSDVSLASGPFVQHGTTLGSWTTATNGVGGVQILTVDDGFGPGIDKVTVKVPRGSASRFMRLNSNQP
ncbi:PA14 domain-containing protein, partial [Luteolibacter marinus]|uniref:PA14 domain-containing protein n=1 Tax=Luteolibacter marinus TaxID=2776705 RepID=UPI001D01FA93